MTQFETIDFYPESEFKLTWQNFDTLKILNLDETVLRSYCLDHHPIGLHYKNDVLEGYDLGVLTFSEPSFEIEAELNSPNAYLSIEPGGVAVIGIDDIRDLRIIKFTIDLSVIPISVQTDGTLLKIKCPGVQPEIPGQIEGIKIETFPIESQ